MGQSAHACEVNQVSQKSRHITTADLIQHVAAHHGDSTIPPRVWGCLPIWWYCCKVPGEILSCRPKYLKFQSDPKVLEYLSEKKYLTHLLVRLTTMFKRCANTGFSGTDSACAWSIRVSHSPPQNTMKLPQQCFIMLHQPKTSAL